MPLALRARSRAACGNSPSPTRVDGEALALRPRGRGRRSRCRSRGGSFDGPHDILEGKAGFLKVFCDHYDVGELTRGLDGKTFIMREIAMKRFGTHGSSQIPLQTLLDIRKGHPFAHDEIESIHIFAAREAVERHDNLSPTDLMQAQYSVPFCIALACVRDVRDPRSLDESALTDPAIHAVLQRVRYEVGDIADKRTCQMTVTLKNRDVLKLTRPEHGVPWRQANREETYEKYAILMREIPRAKTDELFERIQTLEEQASVNWIRV
jgi:2-methylcitrate dehydratase PrpD